jgi:nicotinamide-nucleotide amidase
MNGVVERVSAALVDRGLKLAVAESCTGGMLLARLTDGAGASRFLTAGLVTYSDTSKARLLGVQPGTLARFGAVSEAVALEMVDGVCRAAEAQVGVAITGVAGPGGGSPEKPVGTVWIAAGVAGRKEAELHHFPGDRAEVRERAVAAALEMVERLLQETQ